MKEGHRIKVDFVSRFFFINKKASPSCRDTFEKFFLTLLKGITLLIRGR